MSASPSNSTAPSCTSTLAFVDRLLLWSMRMWVREARTGRSAVPILRQAYRRVSAEHAATLIDDLMQALAVSAVRPIAILCPCATVLSDDERALLHSVGSCKSALWPSDGTHGIGFVHERALSMVEIRIAQISRLLSEKGLSDSATATQCNTMH